MPKPFLLTLEYPPDVGGVAKYLEGEVKNFDGDVVVARAQTMMWPWATRSHPQPKAKGGGGWLPLLWRGRRQFRREHCDGLWVSHVLPIGYIALVWKWLFKTPYRIYVHGLDLVRPQQSPWKKFWARRVLMAADEIVANSNATAALLANYGTNPSRARVQYPRINPPLPEKSPPLQEPVPRPPREGVGVVPGGWNRRGLELRRRYGIENKPLLLTISRLVKRKGIDLVLQALPQVWREIPDLVYVIIGDGGEKENLENISPPLTKGGLGGVMFTGPVSDNEKYVWLAACDCFILTPINDPDDFEGYGIVYKEAQLFGKPVIGSRVGGVPEAVGDNGILVEPGNVEEIVQAISLSLGERAGVRGTTV